MKSMVAIFLLVTFCAYSMIGENFKSHQYGKVYHANMENTSTDCCMKMEHHEMHKSACTDHEKESKGDCEKSCCEDYCFCAKVLNTPMLFTTQDTPKFKSPSKSYVDWYVFSVQHYTFDLLKPPQNIVII